eukprot:4502842-Alexandrium_andersonii.AAC.1
MAAREKRQQGILIPSGSARSADEVAAGQGEQGASDALHMPICEGAIGQRAQGHDDAAQQPACMDAVEQHGRVASGSSQYQYTCVAEGQCE